MLTSLVYIYTLLVFLSICPCVSNRQNDWTDRAHIMCGTSQDPVKGLCNIQIEKTNTILGKWKDFFLKLRQKKNPPNLKII